MRILYAPSGMLLGMTHRYLPIMVLPIAAAIVKSDPALIRASRDLGSGPVATFFRVELPLSLPGIVAGAQLVFAAVLSDFVLPLLLGSDPISNARPGDLRRGRRAHELGPCRGHRLPGRGRHGDRADGLQHRGAPSGSLGPFAVSAAVDTAAADRAVALVGPARSSGRLRPGRPGLFLFAADRGGRRDLVQFFLEPGLSAAGAGGGGGLEWYAAILADDQIWRATGVSAVIALASTAIAVVAGTLAAVAANHYRFAGRNSLKEFLLLP